MIFEFSPEVNAALSAVYALMETALLLYFLYPYTKAGHARITGVLRVAVLLFCAAGMTYCAYTQATTNMVANIAIHYLIVTAVILLLFCQTIGKAAFHALVFHLCTDLSKTLVLDIIPPLSEFKHNGSVTDMLMLLALISVVLFLALMVLRRSVFRMRSEKLKASEGIQIFFPAVPYLYVKYVQYRSYVMGAVETTQEISVMSFGLCLLALVIAVLTERNIVSSMERERSARAQLALERQQEEMQLHLQRIDEINRLSHDMRNHLSTIAAMSQQDEVTAYIESLLPKFRPIVVTPVSGVEALDVLISRKMDECAQAGGALVPCISAEAIEALGALSAPDICTIFGNLLDNAVEAVRAVGDVQMRDVVLRVARRAGFLVIRTENRFEGKRNVTSDAGFATTKPDAAAHGYGMKNVMDVVERLGGEMTAQTQNCQFIVNILLPIKEGMTK